jgi:uncharacterized hydantoinase/oxoprolinase family protein
MKQWKTKAETLRDTFYDYSNGNHKVVKTISKIFEAPDPTKIDRKDSITSSKNDSSANLITIASTNLSGKSQSVSPCKRQTFIDEITNAEKKADLEDIIRIGSR